MPTSPSDRDIGLNLYGGPHDEITIYDDRLATLVVILLIAAIYAHHQNR